MMRKSISMAALTLLCLAWTMNIQAQDTKKSIREHYAAIKKMIAEYAEIKDEEYPVNEHYEVNILQNLPGTGRHQENVIMYYGEKENPEDEVYPLHYLEYVSASYNFAAMKYYEELLFDEKGDITFIYARDPASFSDEFDREFEVRFYFSNGKLFDTLLKSRKEGQKEFTTEFEGKTLPQKYGIIYDHYMDEVKKYKRLFEAVDGSAHL